MIFTHNQVHHTLVSLMAHVMAYAGMSTTEGAQVFEDWGQKLQFPDLSEAELNNPPSEEELRAFFLTANEEDELQKIKRLLSSGWWGYHDVMDVFHEADLPFKPEDEPTMYLDPDEANELHELMKGWETE